MVLRDGFLLAMIGIILGIPAALIGMRSVAHLLFGLKPADPLVLVIGGMFLLAVALAAVFLPARRASRMDPMVALRHE
jgi:ABC-type antimicrobial peptide transport system permease subunit